MANRPMLYLNLPQKVGLMLAGILSVSIPVILGITSAPELRAQAESVLKFEVASVRPSPPLQLPLVTPIRIGTFVSGGRVEFKLMSLRDLILIAYRIRQYQLTGGPDWLANDVYDIQATIPRDIPAIGVSDMQCASDIGPCRVSATRVPEMLQALLAERFGLRIRRENREMPVYALVVSRDGPKFRKSPPEDPQAEPVFLKPPAGGIVAGVGGAVDGAPVRIGPAGGRGFGSLGGPVFDGRGNPTMESLHMEIPRATMERLAQTLTSMVDRPVVDRTGLTGEYEVGFDLPSQYLKRAVMMPMPGKVPRAAPPEDPMDGSIFESVQSLGLQLRKDKAAIETIVVEHVEKTPTEN